MTDRREFEPDDQSPPALSLDIRAGSLERKQPINSSRSQTPRQPVDGHVRAYRFLGRLCFRSAWAPCDQLLLISQLIRECVCACVDVCKVGGGGGVGVCLCLCVCVFVCWLGGGSVYVGARVCVSMYKWVVLPRALSTSGADDLRLERLFRPLSSCLFKPLQPLLI